MLAALTDPAADPAALPLVEPAAALRHLEQRVVSDEVARDVRLGRKIALETGELAVDRRICLLDGRGKLVAVAQPRPDRTLELLRVFHP